MNTDYSNFQTFENRSYLHPEPIFTIDTEMFNRTVFQYNILIRNLMEENSQLKQEV